MYGWSIRVIWARDIIQHDITCAADLLKSYGSRGIIQCDITCAADLLKSW